jgi:uncharacterized membrane protein YkoI
LLLVFSSQIVLVQNAHAFQQAEKKKITKSQAARQAQKAVNGKVLKVELKGSAYRVKIHQSSGRVVFVMVDAYSGKVRK